MNHPPDPNAPAGLPSPEEALTALRQLEDPELGQNVVDLGMVYALAVGPDGAITLDLLLTSPGCPLADALTEGARALLEALPGAGLVEVRLVEDVVWDPSRVAAGVWDR